MDPDTIFVLGLAFGVLSIPAIVSAISDGRTPRFATIMTLLAGVMIVYAMQQKPDGYSLEEIPAVISRVINGLT